MKKWLVNVFATTGVSLLLLTLAALYLKAEWLLLVSIFQVFFLNGLIQLLVLFIRKLEWESFMLQVLVEIVAIEGLTMGMGWLFHWNQPWMFLLIGIAVYVISQVLDLFDLSQEAREINLLIKNRR
ncbi:hypothetical protein ACVR1G_08820 [Streptococcus dentasini]|uniref:hypothetical protein n=1 Tax=Streptococcus tangpeifui TaxID=2709400 RepID=UPI0013EABE53|nr:hypothetical protein [Streptococcus sp. ZJ373]